MSNNSITGQAFNVLRPFCIDFIQKRDLISLQRLHEKLINVNKDSLDDIAGYVSFPFQVLLKTQSLNEDLLLSSLQCLQYIFSNASVRDWNLLSGILSSISRLVSDKDSHEHGACGSEELKHAVADVFAAIFDRGASFVVKSLYDHSTIPLLGHIVTVLLSICQDNIERNARISALQALHSLCKPSYCTALDEGEQNLVKAQIADAMACFLPGVSSCLVKVIVNSSSGQNVRSNSIKALGTFMVTILGDAAPKSGVPLSKDIHPKLKTLIVNRDEKWTKQVVEKLGKIIESVCSSSNSDEFMVRMSCVKFCGRILLECTKTMESHVVTLLNASVKLLNDEYPQIRDSCHKILNEFSAKLQNNDSGNRVLSEILEENLFALSTSLPRIMRGGDDAEKLSNLKIFLGYIGILKKQIIKLISSLPHMSKLATALLHCFELDSSSIQLLEISSSEITQQEMTKSCFRKRFKHFRDDKVYFTMSEICRNLGKYGDIEILTDYFMDLYNSSESYCKQSVFIVLEILSGAPKNDILSETIKSLLDEFLSQENWYLVTTFDSDYSESYNMNRMKRFDRAEKSTSLIQTNSSSSFRDVSSKFVKNNVLLCCLHLDAILTFSRLMKTDFRGYLMHALYPLLEKTVDQDESLSSCAIRALGGVALNCGYDSTSELIANNADYLISNISIQIHKLHMFPRCPAVLRAILNHSDSNILPLIYDTVDEIVEALDQHHLEPKKMLMFIPVLLAVTSGVNRWMKDNPMDKSNTKSVDAKSPSENSPTVKETSCLTIATNNETPSCKNHASFVSELRNQLLELHKQKKVASMETEPEVDPAWDPSTLEDEQYPNMDENPKPEKPPMEIQVVTKVLTRCLHLMAHSDPRIRIRIMEVIETGMVALSQSENELLPMAHKIWSPLIVRFGDKELQVVMKAFDTLCVIARYAKTFLRKRFCKDILPKLLSVLEYHATRSNLMKKSDGDNVMLLTHMTMKTQDSVAYKHSVAFKLQRRVLSELGSLLQDLDVTRKDHILICKSLVRYLSSRQPSELQQSAVDLFRHLIKVDSDLTWVELTRVWCQKSTIYAKDHLVCSDRNFESFRTVHLGGSTDPHHEYASNVKRLLKYCT